MEKTGKLFFSFSTNQPQLIYFTGNYRIDDANQKQINYLSEITAAVQRPDRGSITVFHPDLEV